MKQMSKIASGIAIVSLLLSACNSSSGGSAGADTTNPSIAEKVNDKLNPVNLVWYYPVSTLSSDMQTVQDAVNKITKEKISATVKLMPQVFGDYPQKMNTVLAAGDQVDMLWTSNWNFDHLQSVSKGVLLPLDKLIDQYAPEAKKNIPPYIWDATQINGQYYGFPSYQIMVNKEGLILQKRFVEKYNLDITKVKSMQDLEPFMKQIKEGESKDIVPFVSDRRGKLNLMSRYFGLELVSNGTTLIGAVDWNNPSQIINLYDTQQYKSYLDFMRDWYIKGYINNNAAVTKNVVDIQKKGNSVSYYHNVLKPGLESELKVASAGQDMVILPLADAYATTGQMISSLQAINKDSKYPERAMMLLNLINTDKDLFNLLSFGVEGKHYKKVSDNTVVVIPEGGYTGLNWVFGNTFNGFLKEGQDENLAVETIKMNETAKSSPILGFKFDPSKVLAEIANITSVRDQYAPVLETGTIAANEKLAEFQDKLKQAGIDKVIQEMQVQLDEWNMNKKQ